MKKLLFLLIIPVFIALYFVSRPSLQLDVTPAFYAPVVSTVYATGIVESKQQADLSTLVTARITKFNVEEGDEVKIGKSLVEFDDTEARAVVASLEAQLKFHEIELRRQTELAAKKFGSEQAKESAQSTVDKLKADLSVAEKKLAEHQIVAPQTGVILKKTGDVGEVVQPGKTLISIGQPDNLHIEAEIDEEGLPGLNKGQKVLIKADAYPGDIFYGKISDITPLGDSINKNYRVYVAFDEMPPFSISMTVDCNIITAEKEKALLVPATAIRNNMLWMVKSGELEPVDVKIGIRGDRFIEVLEGLEEGDEVVTKNKDDLKQGESVRTKLLEMSIKDSST